MKLKQVWNGLRDLKSILGLCRSSVLVLAVGFAFLLLVPQGRDVVLALAEEERRLSDRLGLLIWFFLATGFWAVNIWYWARIMLRFDWKTEARGRGASGHAETLRKQVPRLLGTLAFAVVALAFVRSAVGSSGKTALGHWLLAGWSVVFMVIFFTATALRKKAMGAAHSGLSRIDPLRKGAAAKVVDMLDVTSPGRPNPYDDRYSELKDLPAGSRVFLTILVAVTLGLFVTFAIHPGAGTVFGAAPILMLAGAAWVVFGAVLIYAGTRLGIPALTTVVLLVVVFSLWNDNHTIRTLAPRTASEPGSVADHFDAWLDDRAISASSVDGAFPVVVVAAEGGGIRAAYWTAAVLAKLEDDYTGFADHLYAISGVSGGSLGGATYAALVKERARGSALDCSVDSDDRGPFESCAHEMLRRDFLSPTVASMFYPDLVQRFFFFPIPSFDRARAMEQAWERAWSKLPGVDTSRFGGSIDDPSFDDLWREDLYRVPLLFLNTTAVETGKRVIISPLPIGDESVDTEDFFEIVGRSVRLSTAVQNSARFTYVSPAGTVKDLEGKTWGHLVDGGYFENSGATTALEILQAMKEGAGDRWKKVRPVVLMITNDPKLGTQRRPRRLLKEIRSPIAALLATRGARGSYSREALEGYVEGEDGRYAELDLTNEKGVPLGWVLSDDAITTMKDRLELEVEEARTALQSPSS